MIYLDNAATSWPKAPTIGAAITGSLETMSTPGRAGHLLSIEASRLMADTRVELAEFFDFDQPERIIFTKNVTEALNVAIMGLYSRARRIVVSGVEHNAVMRPLRHLAAIGEVELKVVSCHEDGSLIWGEFAQAMDSGVDLLVTTHASNVLGTIMPVLEMSEFAHSHGALVVVDAAQTAGSMPFSMRDLGVDVLAFTGHKGLLGPTGVGGLLVGPSAEPDPLIRGGTGSMSELEVQPEFLPDRLESGTPNVCGIAGFRAAVKYVTEFGVERIHRRAVEIGCELRRAASKIEGIKVHGPTDGEAATGVISVSLRGLSPSDVGLLLEQRFGIMARVGLHCAPAAHRTAGTYPVGTTRLSWGPFTSDAEIDTMIEGLAALARGR